MSINETIFSKENWQSFLMSPGPSNLNELGFPTAPKVRQTSAGRAMKQTWSCGECGKELSSKRSYTEHMNIHNGSRPFQCENCAYAAASQMTLHRHKLRNHIPKTEWGYRCPYCEEAYMEPAGYQQHVQQRHPGRSCTYGCPFKICKFMSKSQRHFKEHLVKHDRSDKIEGNVDPCALKNEQLVRYTVTDEIGQGFCRPVSGSAPTPSVTIRARPQKPIAPKTTGEPSTRGLSVWHVEEIIRNKPNIKSTQGANDANSIHTSQQYYYPHTTYSHEGYNDSVSQSFDNMNLEHEYIGNDCEENDSEDEAEEYDDEPPHLESFGRSMHPINEDNAMQTIRNETKSEANMNDVIILNGFIDDELD